MIRFLHQFRLQAIAVVIVALVMLPSSSWNRCCCAAGTCGLVVSNTVGCCCSVADGTGSCCGSVVNESNLSSDDADFVSCSTCEKNCRCLNKAAAKAVLSNTVPVESDHSDLPVAMLAEVWPLLRETSSVHCEQTSLAFFYSHNQRQSLLAVWLK